MNKLENIDDEHYLFGSIPILANRMDTLLDRAFAKYGVTAKQWLLSIMLFSLFTEAPTIKEAAREMGTSHQNLKQVALKLQEKGLVRLEKDKKDARATRVKLTEASGPFWGQSNGEGQAFMELFYKGIAPGDLKTARAVIEKLLNNLNDIETDFKEDERE